MPITLLVGGVRSGKSSLAVEMGRRFPGKVVFLATAEAFDDDLRVRIARHRDERPPWPTVEVALRLADAVATADPDALLIVDCLTVWVGNLFQHEPGAEVRAAMATELVDALVARPGPCVVVSNEVGLGVVPDNELARAYRDELGRLNQAVATVSATALFVVAGKALPLRDPWALL